MSNHEFKFEADLRPNGKKETFASISEFQNWLDGEKNFWNLTEKLPPNKQTANHYFSSFVQRFNELQRYLNIVKSKENTSEFQFHRDQLVNRLFSFYRNNELLHSSVPFSKFIKDLANKNSELAIFALKYFLERRFEAQNQEQIEGMFATLSFEFGLKGNSQAELESLQELRLLWQDHLNTSKDRLDKTAKEYENLLKEYNEKRSAQEKISQASLELIKKEHGNILEENRKQLNLLIDLYKSKLGLHSAIEYWQTKSKSHRKFTLWFSGAVLICFFLAALGLFCSIKMFIGEDTIQTVELWKLASLALGAMIGVWVLRVLIRLLLSNYHLMSDANERGTMLLTYLALQQENKLPQEGESLRLILQALFRPTSTGIIKDDALPAFAAGWLRHVTGDD